MEMKQEMFDALKNDENFEQQIIVIVFLTILFSSALIFLYLFCECFKMLLKKNP